MTPSGKKFISSYVRSFPPLFWELLRSLCYVDVVGQFETDHYQ
jgi:hypothetical protein